MKQNIAKLRCHEWKLVYTHTRLGMAPHGGEAKWHGSCVVRSRVDKKMRMANDKNLFFADHI